jgi:hypothetical protein
MKHKHCDLIKAWADGAEIEQRHPLSSYPVWEDLCKYPAWSEYMEYRIKPKTIKYRVALFTDNSLAVSSEVDAKYWEENRWFKRWVTDWQKVEV